MNYTDAKRKIAEISAAHPIPPDRVYPADREAADRREADLVRKWLHQTSGTGASAPAPAGMSAQAVCDVVVEIVARTVAPIVEDMQRQISELAKRAKLSEQRCLALEQRAVRAEERLAKTEERQLGPLMSGMSSHSKAH